MLTPKEALDFFKEIASNPVESEENYTKSLEALVDLQCHHAYAENIKDGHYHNIKEELMVNISIEDFRILVGFQVIGRLREAETDAEIFMGLVNSSYISDIAPELLERVYTRKNIEEVLRTKIH
ncbi:MAG: hypothetical protein GY928_36330 [Colwellia sp.]|nr:hypothetical protein [Colwellia sp.]